MTTEPDAATILRLEDRRFQAMTAGNLAVVDALLAEDLRFVHSNGLVEDKPEFLRKLRAGERRYLAYRALARAVRQEGGFSFVFGEADAEIERPGGGLRTRMTYTAIYRNAPEPRLFAWHSVKSPAASPTTSP
jgi:hypothetical protein